MKPTFISIFFLSIIYINAQELALVRDNDLFGYINTSGEYVIQPQFKNASDFSEGYAAALKDEKWGFINKKGEVLGGKWHQNAELFANTKK